MMSLSFYSGHSQLSSLTASIIIITGTARSGKTTVGNLLGSCQHVEHIEEPWLLIMLPILAGYGLMPETLARQMFQTYTSELANDRLLMRNVNFRPADLSSIWKQKAPEEIFTRLIGLYSRDDVRKYASEKRPTFVLTLTHTLPFYDFFWKALPGCRVIHVLREGLDVAIDVAEKHWLSDGELMRPIHAQPYRVWVRPSDHGTLYLNWWVETGGEERFLSFSEFGRGLYYWRRLMEMADVHREGGRGQQMHVVKLEDVINRPRQTVGALIESLGITKTEITERLLAKIVPQEQKYVPYEPRDEIEREELTAVKKIYQKLGLPTHKIDKLLST